MNLARTLSRHQLLYLADMLDAYVLGHRWISICDRITFSPWWPAACSCPYCLRFR